MRDIKFRAFHTEYKEMIYLENSGLQYYDFEGSYSLGFTVDGYTGFWAHEQYKTATEKANKFPIMQYTGLKDNTKWNDLTDQEKENWLKKGNTQSEWAGKEIYECDIVLLYGVKCKIIFEDGIFLAEEIIDSQNKHVMWHSSNALELLGNVYQNPELS